MAEHPPCRVSVVMLTVDRPQYINAAIASVAAQSFESWELIVVHDGDDDRIRAAVSGWLEREPRIRYFHRAVLGNIANALNYALAQAQGEFVAILDDDDFWIHPGKLQAQVAVIEGQSAVVCTGGGAAVVNSTGNESMRYLKSTDPTECRRRALLANPLIHSTALYRRSTALAVGGYDERLRAYADWDFCLKIMQRGDLLNLPQHFATYRIWQGGSSSRYGMSIAWSALQIVNRHRDYPYYPAALAISIGHVIFALFPAPVRKRIYGFLTRWKKRHF